MPVPPLTYPRLIHHLTIRIYQALRVPYIDQQPPSSRLYDPNLSLAPPNVHLRPLRHMHIQLYLCFREAICCPDD